ncbi:MAG: hypothetical protein LBF67_03770 [Prevotellaceae bacterium]|jgi:hypothetical protein|nr:hypothetical protein [Prevotellaceae bacterium]
MKYLYRLLPFTLLALHAAVSCRAGVNVFPHGSRAAALGNLGVTNTDIFAAYNNQAALGFLSSPQAAIHYENKYITEALNLSAAAFAMPAPVAGTLGLDLCSFGYARYHETRIGIAWGKLLSKRIAVGAQLGYHLMQVAGYGSTNALTAELGLLAEPVDNLWVGAHVFNFTNSRYLSSSYHERLPVIFDVGVGYRLAQHASLLVGVKIESEQAAQAKAGLEVVVLKTLALRLGVLVKPVEVFAGFGYTYRKLHIDMAFSRHETLRYTPQISLSYNFSQTQKK